MTEEASAFIVSARAGIGLVRSAGFQTCRIADFQVGRAWNSTAGLMLTAIRRFGNPRYSRFGNLVWKPALRLLHLEKPRAVLCPAPCPASRLDGNRQFEKVRLMHGSKRQLCRRFAFNLPFLFFITALLAGCASSRPGSIASRTV